jgi:protein-tyrosine-phosphatase
MGEAVLSAAAKKRGLNIVVDSCGTAGYHIGEDPDDVSVSSLLGIGEAYSLFPAVSAARLPERSRFIGFCRTISTCKKVCSYASQ